MAARALSRWLPAALYASLIWWLSSQPRLRLTPDVSDKLAHGLLFGLFAALVWRGVAGSFRASPTRGTALAALLLCGGYGVVDEVHQAFVPGRTPSAADAVADLAGAAVALAVLWAVARLRAGAPGDESAAAATGAVPVLRLLSRKDCHLCDEAEEVLRSVQREIDFRYEKVDVDSDARLASAYGDEVPVVLMDGRKIFKFKVDPVRLRRKLARAAGEVAE